MLDLPAAGSHRLDGMNRDLLISRRVHWLRVEFLSEPPTMGSCGIDGGSDGWGNVLRLDQDATAASDG